MNNKPSTKPDMVQLRAWVEETVKQLQEYGFFQGDGFFKEKYGTFVRRSYAGLNSKEIADYLAGRFQEWSPYNFPSLDAEWHLLTHDASHVWYRDTDIAMDTTWTEILYEWQAISRGRFDFTSISERHRTPDGRWAYTAESVGFLINGTPAELRPHSHGDYLDLGVLHEINRVIRPSGVAYESVGDGGKVGLVVLLTSEQKERLDQERGWRFGYVG